MQELSAVLERPARPEIAQAWKRAEMSGLHPGMDLRGSVVATVDRRSRLLAAANPVLDAMYDDLANTQFSVILADRTATIVDRRVADRKTEETLDRINAVPGVQFLEEFTGTNALATAFELQRPIAVTGEEHYLESLRVFCCYGAPIFNRVTRRLEGVLDVTGPVSAATPLLGPFLQRVVHDIEVRVLDGARGAEKQLFAEFQQHSRNKRHAVLVLGESIALSNPTALDMVEATDHALLRSLAKDLLPSAMTRRAVTLSSGMRVDVIARAVAGAGGIVFDVVPCRQGPARGSTPIPSPAQARGRTAIIGEPGTGRTRAALESAGERAQFIDCADAVADELLWVRMAVAVISGTDEPVILDNLHMLSARAVASLVPAARSHDRLVITSSPIADLDFEHASLLAIASHRRELPPVRMYGERFSELAHTVLREMQSNNSLRLTPSAMQLLAVQKWPGNIRELQSVLLTASRGRTQGDVTAADLPAIIRAEGAQRRLTVMELAERDAIVSALTVTGGNRKAAAADLGIGRTTLYQRLRRYGIGI